MNNYNPDGWVIVKITHENDIIYKVFASWSGGYLHGDSWKLSSGIVKIEETENEYSIHNHSGSVYTVRKDDENFLSGYNRCVLDNWIHHCEGFNTQMEVVPLTAIRDVFK